jgi:hypothetical protein
VLGHLRCQEPAQARDARPPLLREGDLGRHAAEAFGQRLELVAGGDPDPMLELPGAEPLGPLLQEPDRPDQALREPVGEGRGERGTEQQEDGGPPEGLADVAKASVQGCSTNTSQSTPGTGAMATATVTSSMPVVATRRVTDGAERHPQALDGSEPGGSRLLQYPIHVGMGD